MTVIIDSITGTDAAHMIEKNETRIEYSKNLIPFTGELSLEEELKVSEKQAHEHRVAFLRASDPETTAIILPNPKNKVYVEESEEEGPYMEDPKEVLGSILKDVRAAYKLED